MDRQTIHGRGYHYQRTMTNTINRNNILDMALPQRECSRDVVSTHEMQMVHGLMFIMSIPTGSNAHTQNQIHASWDSGFHGKCILRSWIHDRRHQDMRQQYNTSQTSMDTMSNRPMASIVSHASKPLGSLTRTSIMHHGTRVGILQPRINIFHNSSSTNPTSRRKPLRIPMYSNNTNEEIDSDTDIDIDMDKGNDLEIIGNAYSKAAGVAALPAPIRARRRLNAFMPMTTEERDKALEQARAQYLGYRQKQMHDLEELTKSPFKKSPLHESVSTRPGRSATTHRSIPMPNIPSSSHASSKRIPSRSSRIPNQNRVPSRVSNVPSAKEYLAKTIPSVPANTSPPEPPKPAKTKSLDTRLRIRVKEREDGSRTRKPYGYWNNLVNVRAELEEFLADLDDELDSPHHRKTKLVLPIFPELARRNRHDLIGAIRKIGGRNAAAKALGIPLAEALPKPANAEKAEEAAAKANMASSRRPYGYWNDMDNCVLELSKYIKDHNKGAVPTIAKLRKDKQFVLLKSIQLHGGISVVLEHLPFVKQSSKKPYGYWTKIENVKNELIEFVKARKSAVPFGGMAAASMNGNSSSGGGNGKGAGRTGSSGSSTTRFGRSIVVVHAHVKDDVRGNISITDSESEDSQTGKTLPPWLSLRPSDLINAGHGCLAKAVTKFGGLEQMLAEIAPIVE